MKLTIFFLLFIASLNAKDLETCYSVQLLSFPSSEPASSVYMPKNCQIIAIGKHSSIRCGCKNNFDDIKNDLLTFKSNYPNATLVNTYKYRFNTEYHKNTENLKENYNKIDWNKYTIEALKKDISQELHGDNVNLISVERLYFLSKENTYEQKRTWEKAGILWPKAIVLGSGRYDVHKLYKSIDNENIIEKVKKNEYIIKRPLYISPSASLLLQNVTIKFSNFHGVYLTYHGDLDIVDSTITSWSIKESNYGPREYIKDNELLFYMKSKTRPYLLGLEGSFTKILNSDIIGLGYKGQSGTFGISFSKSIKKLQPLNLKSFFRKQKKPEGILVGNNISKCFFGFYANNAQNMMLAGNILHDNIIYNFDPHDFAKGLTIAKNISYKAGHAHGIIFSREVHDSIIAENITFANHGTGIMLDRNCENNLIYKNTCFENSGDGIAIFESSKNVVSSNAVLRNDNNGIFIRNSHDVTLENNLIYHNANNGAEVSVVDIGKLETRNFELDPYEKRAQASFIGNHFEKNSNSALSSKNGAAILFKNNTLNDSGPVYFSGELEEFTEEILKKNKNNGYKHKPTVIGKR